MVYVYTFSTAYSISFPNEHHFPQNTQTAPLIIYQPSWFVAGNIILQQNKATPIHS